MKITRRMSAWLAALTVLALSVCAMAQVAPGGLELDEFTKVVQSIESAANPDAAASAYAKGCTMNRRSSRLQLAYLRRMLQLGRPDIAQFPAEDLSTIDPKCGLAWGTLAYMHAKKAQYLLALPPAVKAAELEPTNNPICLNAAQLVAWFEAGKRGTVSPEIAAAMKELPSASKEYAAAYKRAKDAFKKLAETKADKDKQVKDADAEAKQAEEEHKKYADKLKSAGETYRRELQRLQDAVNDYNRIASNSTYRSRNTGRLTTSTSNQQARDAAQRRINDIRQNLRQQENEGKKIRGEMEKAKKNAAAKREAANKLAAEAKKLGDSMPDNFGWLPPAVDGVATPDATAAKPAARKASEPGSSYLVPDEPAAQPAANPPASIEQRLAEAQAADKLQMAKLCLASGDDDAMKARARELLDEIVAQFGSTPSAAEAKQLLETLK